MKPRLGLSKDRVVGSAHAPSSPSAQRYSLTPLLSTANPSADLENGVLPDPLSWISCRPPSGEVVSTAYPIELRFSRSIPLGMTYTTTSLTCAYISRSHDRPRVARPIVQTDVPRTSNSMVHTHRRTARLFSPRRRPRALSPCCPIRYHPHPWPVGMADRVDRTVPCRRERYLHPGVVTIRPDTFPRRPIVQASRPTSARSSLLAIPTRSLSIRPARRTYRTSSTILPPRVVLRRPPCWPGGGDKGTPAGAGSPSPNVRL